MLAGLLAVAPLQCPTPRPFEQRREESPAEALWLLAERFQLEQQPVAQRRSLQFLIERYPSTRFAARARTMLETSPENDRVLGDAGQSVDR